MLQRGLHIALSVWLAILLIFGSTAKEYIHLFADHTDTPHDFHGDGLRIEPEHHHCAFLSFTLPAYVNDHYSPVILFSDITYPVATATAVQHLIPGIVYTTPLRGPPSFI